MTINIIEITSEQIIDIRHQVVWSDKSINYLRLPNDTDGKHFGLFIND